MGRTTHVRSFIRTLKDGTKTPVSAHERTLPDTRKYDVISDEWAESFNEKRLLQTSPDMLHTSKVTFLGPNQLWVKYPNKYDVLNLDATSIPQYDELPKSGLPNQIIAVGNKFYLGNERGVFEEYNLIQNEGDITNVVVPFDKVFNKGKEAKELNVLSENEKKSVLVIMNEEFVPNGAVNKLDGVKKIAKTYKKNKSRPSLNRDQKYFIISIDEDGHARFIEHTIFHKKALADLEDSKRLFKKIKSKERIRLFVAEDMHDVREQIREEK